MFRIKSIFLSILFSVILNTIQATENLVKITVTADHPNWVYKLNERPIFKIVLTQDGKPMNNIKINYEIEQEKMPPTVTAKKMVKDGELEVTANALTKPGFMRCKVTADLGGVKYEGLCTVAFSPEEIKPTTTLPKDFKSFWMKSIADNAKIPMDPHLELLSGRCTDRVNVYQVNIQNCSLGMRVYGILCVPKANGKYPAVLEVPGAGVRPYKGDTKLAEQGVITFQIGIHGIPVNLDSIVYADLKFGALNNYFVSNIDNRDNYYYKHVFLGCIRANDFLCSLPEFDGVNLAVMGGSQGGALSIATAALDSRVKTLSCMCPALCDLDAWQFGRAGGWPYIFKHPENRTKDKLETSRYFDTVNFARMLHVPGFYSFGFNDQIAPPTSVYSAYNSIYAPKKLFIVKEAGHLGVSEQYIMANKFILQSLHVSK